MRIKIVLLVTTVSLIAGLVILDKVANKPSVSAPSKGITSNLSSVPKVPKNLETPKERGGNYEIVKESKLTHKKKYRVAHKDNASLHHRHHNLLKHLHSRSNKGDTTEG